MTLRVDEQGRPVALVAYSPSQPRVESGPTAGQWVSDGTTDNSASQNDDEAKRLYADLLNLPPEQRAAYLAKLSPDQLTRLGKFASTGKEAKGVIADLKTSIGNAMTSRGLNPATAGLKAKPGKKGPAKKGGKSGGGGSKGGGKSSGGGSKGGGSKKSGGGSSKKSSGSSSKSGSKSSGSKSSSSKTPAKTTAPKPTPAPPAPPAVKPIGLPGRPGARPTPGPPSTQPVRPAGRVGKRRRRAAR